MTCLHWIIESFILPGLLSDINVDGIFWGKCGTTKNILKKENDDEES